MDVVTVLVSLGGAVLSGGGLAVMGQAIAKRRTAPAEITSRLNDAAMSQVDQLQERVREADLAARDARRESEGVTRDMRAVRQEANELAERLSALIRMIHSPEMTLERLRSLVPMPPGRNGAPWRDRGDA